MRISQFVMAALIGTLSYTEVCEAVQLNANHQIEDTELLQLAILKKKHHKKAHKHSKKHSKKSKKGAKDEESSDEPLPEAEAKAAKKAAANAAADTTETKGDM